jgi:hypothetical protein
MFPSWADYDPILEWLICGFMNKKSKKKELTWSKRINAGSVDLRNNSYIEDLGNGYIIHAIDINKNLQKDK